MTRTFRRHGDAIRMEVEPFELELLNTVLATLRERLENPQLGDAVLDRLFPACAPDDDVVDAEVRSLIYDDLLDQRFESLELLRAILDRATPHRGRLRVDLVDDEPGVVLAVVNDLRLMLGARIGIDRLDRDEIDEGHPAAWSVAVMDHFAWLQEQLIRVLDPPASFDDLPPEELGAG